MASETTITVSREVLVNLGDFNNVKIGATASRVVPTGDTASAISDLSDELCGGLAYEVETLGADPKKYGLK